MKQGNLNRFFNASFQERISVFTLIGLLIGTTLLYLYIHWNPPIPDFKIEHLKLPEEEVTSMASYEKSNHLSDKPIFTSFNPNKVTAQELNKFSIPAKTVSAWLHYLEKGGKFRKPADVKKIFGMNEVLLNKIYPYIQMEEPAKENDPDIPDAKPKTAIDPNFATYVELVQAGFPNKMANTLLHYRTSGKTFSSANDVLKIYGMNDSLLKEVLPYIRFPEPDEPLSLIKPPMNTIILPIRLDLNKADTGMLKSLPGIGHVLAMRIIAYREKLGGFFSIDQLKEVYGLQDTTISRFRSRLTVTEPFKKIKINQDSLTQIYHPYLTKKDAGIIQNYRLQHGEFKTEQDLYNLKAFDHGYWERMLPYLDFSVR